jgi:hypothetical protein
MNEAQAEYEHQIHVVKDASAKLNLALPGGSILTHNDDYQYIFDRLATIEAAAYRARILATKLSTQPR